MVSCQTAGPILQAPESAVERRSGDKKDMALSSSSARAFHLKSPQQVAGEIALKTEALADWAIPFSCAGQRTCRGGSGMNIEFLATVAVIAPDPPVSRKLYVDVLGLPLESHGGDYHHSEQIDGCKSFGIWPLSQAADACFGTSQWPTERPVPQVSIEFDVTDAAAVGPAARELEQAGYELLHPPRKEPWGQTVARLQSPEGAIVGISYAPVLHEQD
jgi:catechol 2,3-dioxygenase-like lactoylglutathione lyase family enzyme